MDPLLAVALTNAGTAAVMAVGIAAIEGWIRRPAVVRGLWILVLLKLLTPPVIELGLPIRRPPPAAPALAQPVIQTSDSAAAALTGQPCGPILTIEAMVLIPWVAGALAMCALTLVRTARWKKLLAGAVAAPKSLQARVATLATKLGIAHPPRAVVIDARVSPMLWAALSSFQLIVPAALLERLSAAELDALVVHELAHLRRRDHCVRGLELIALVLFWWHPVVRWACHRLRRAEEQCCDALVAQALPGHHRAYADCLLKTMKFLAAHGAPTTLWPAASARFKTFKGD